MIRTVQVEEITENIKDMCIKAAHFLPEDMRGAMKCAEKNEKSPLGRQILEQLEENLSIAAEEMIPICQDTGMACVFAEIGQDVHITGGSFEEAVDEGVRQGYTEGYLRKSVVADPIRRGNTGDNTPAVLTVRLVPGDKLRLTLAPKGFGSENMSRLAMLRPSDGEQGVKDFVLDAVRRAGPNPCPPVVVGVGIGGTFDRVALLAKRALLRPLGSRHPDPYYAAMEQELLEKINELGTGPQGFGGRTTALGLQIETFPTHIAGLPVAVNINCHVTRHAEVVL